jgi:hypothetical protein
VSWGLHGFIGALLLSYLASTWAWAALGRHPQAVSGRSRSQYRQVAEDAIEGGG